ncbi:hypothetical protein M011DRAFT_477651 [Sporormia fimetaria CBS 119925]|uniref:histidine kinase n=1 Tax=Sporormia fimetaria CBS 119925 TaxID=1340428 RepID=A0A6A6V8E7_9PLEO|nr:hypothetical protein M011DRAFT_477651 [Sporormia fimetaria CBS 119925]
MAGCQTPTPWPIDPEHGRVKGPGYLGDSYHSLRVRELFRYYQPPTPDELRHVAPINIGNDFVKESRLISAVDPILTALANLTTRVMDMRRCVVSMTGAGTSYVIAESTRTMSLTYPHTHGPGDALMLGGGVATSSLGGLCEHTCSLLPPPADSDEPFLLEIPDLSRHPKFYNVGYVRDWPHSRFYCGAPLRTKNGVTIGTVCVLDDQPRYKGLTEKERLDMSNMADLFMNYFETKEGSRFHKKGQLMELELSRFISEGYLPSDGGEMVERRNGRVFSESILNAKREKEKERRKKVLAKRQIIQEREYAKMKEEEELRESPLNNFTGSSLPGMDDGRPVVPVSTLIDNTNMVNTRPKPLPTPAHSYFENATPEVPKPTDEQLATEALVPIVHPLQPGIIELVPASAAEEKLSLLSSVGTATSETENPPKEGGMIEHLAEPLGNSVLGNASLTEEPNSLARTKSWLGNPSTAVESAPKPATKSFAIKAETDTSSLGLSIPRTGDMSNDLLSSTAASSTGLTDRRRRSKYEETATMEPHLRAMFARASTVMKNTLGCDVVFVHGDLEGFFEPDEDPQATDEWAWSHVSTDGQTESQIRAKRPKQYRQRSGVLGYATSKGSSSARFDGPKNILDLGFDMSELREEHINFLLKDSRGGKIFSFFDEYPGLEEHEDPEETECKNILRKFLPGCRSVIVLPLHDHNHVLSSICFAWTCSDQKTFYSDEEGRFAAGVATSLMDEMARMHILSADKAKSEFISSISHELRSPLHGILASAEFLVESDPRPDQQSFVETIMSCGTTLLDTVNHVLDFQKLNFLHDAHIKRIEAPPSPDDFQHSSEDQSDGAPSTPSSISKHDNLFDTRDVDIDLSTILQEITEGIVLGYEFKDLSKYIGQSEETKKAALDTPTKMSKIQVVVDIDELEGGWIFRTNPAAIKRIVGNLVGNAVKYSHDSGWIKITLTAKKIDPTPNGLPRAKVSFIVSDSGKGMSREFLKTRLFTPFTQENPMAPGAGLGMSIVRQLVDMLDGKIDVKSRLGKGTTFRIEMKLTQAKPSKSSRHTESELEDTLPLSKLHGKNALFLNFPHFDSPETPDQRAQNLLHQSVTRYVKDLLQMEPILDLRSADASNCHLIIANELSSLAALHEMTILKDRPVMLMSNSTLRKSVLDHMQFDRNPSLVTFLRKPCGPKKLRRAAQACLEIMENGHASQPDTILGAPGPSRSNVANLPAPHVNSRAADTAQSTSLAVRPLASPTKTPEAPSETIGPDHKAYQTDTQQQEALSSTPVPTSPPPCVDQAFTQTATVQAKLHQSSEIASVSTSATVSMTTTVDTQPQKPRILCVEDNKINMMLVTTYLKKNHYPFSTAYDGAEALEVYKASAASGGFDCILMDIQMPVMSGIGATQEIRALESAFPETYKRAFIIALTGLAAGSDRTEAFEAGVDAFMVKPVSFKDLEKLLKELRARDRKDGKVEDGKAVQEGVVSVESERAGTRMIEVRRVVLKDGIGG